MPRRVLLTAIVAVVAMGTLGVRFWWIAEEPKRAELTPDWAATVHVLAGDGVIGHRDGSGDRARFADPFGVAAGADGLIYTADGAGGDRVRVVSPQGDVATLAGGLPGLADGRGAEARFSSPSGLAFDRQGMLYVADTGNNAIRRVAPDGHTNTVAGTGAPGFRDGVASDARFNAPIGLAIDTNGRVLVADTYNDRVRIVTADGVVTTLAGGNRGFADGHVNEALFDTPCGIAVAPDGTVYVADTGNDRVRAISTDGVVSTIADATHGLARPLAVAVAATGELYVTDEAGRVFERTRAGTLRVIAGSVAGYRDGRGADALFRRPAGVAWLAPGLLVVADAGNALMRLVEAETRAGVRAPPSPNIAPQFDAGDLAHHPLLWPVAPQYGPFEVAGTMGEARGGDASRFHAGIDVRAEQGAEVLAVRDGVIQTPLAAADFGTLNESLRIGPVAYVHIRVGRDIRAHVADEARFTATRDDTGRVISIRAKRGARFRTGEVVGTINPFNHVHLNIGWAGEEYNPLLFRMVQFQDSVAPTIAAGGVRLYGEDGRQFVQRVNRRLIVSGNAQIIVDAWDRADGNRADRRLGVFELGYQVLTPAGAPAPGFAQPRMTLRFDRLSQQPDAPSLVYGSGSGIPFYGQRRTRFLYIVTNTFRDGQAGADVWRTSELTPGDYTLRILAVDASGNVATANRDLPVTIVQ
jgi:hypothetical protein